MRQEHQAHSRRGDATPVPVHVAAITMTLAPPDAAGAVLDAVVTADAAQGVSPARFPPPTPQEAVRISRAENLMRHNEIAP